jgi:glycosyltransferase involved in cell wall biosynthesis
MPWKTEGVFRNFDQNRFNQDPGYQRYVAYGNTAVEEFVTKNKLDVLFAVEDVWAFETGNYLASDWFNHIKNNVVLWATADSEPILYNFKEWALKCPNVWFWASFAERCLREEDREKFGHCKTLYGSINSKLWSPLKEEERKKLRNSFGIADDEKIILYLGRNQLRKLFWSHMEALKKWKQKFPNKKIRLLFHCNWSEGGMGWPLQAIRDELKLTKEDVLATYYCKSCGSWNVQPFLGEDLDCPECEKKNQRITAGVGSTITESELNKIYNLADGSCSVFTSGGFEYTHAESLLAGVPLASVNYSCGEDFCKNDFVYSIQGGFTREIGSAFKKFVPNIDSIINFYDYIYSMRTEKKNKLTQQGRQWAVENFDVPIIADKIMKFIDQCKPIDWDIYFNRKREVKNPNAGINFGIEDNYEFVNHAYKEVLNMHDMTREKPEVIHWINFLSQDRNKMDLRNGLVNTFRQVAAQKNAENNPVEFKTLLLDNGKKHFLIVCPMSAGDILYGGSLLESFRQSYPSSEWNIYFACNPEFFELLDLNPYIDKLLPFQDFMNNEILCIGQSSTKGLFQGYSFLTAGSQKFLNYLGNHNINVSLE